MPTYSILNGDYTALAKTSILNMMRGGSTGGTWHPSFIDIGVGGNYTPAGVGPGNRVAPDPTETNIRQRLFRSNIIYTRVTGENRVTYISYVEGHESISANIDEFALVAANQTMIAHLVLPSAVIPGPTVPFSKTGAVRLFLEWSIDLDLVI